MLRSMKNVPGQQQTRMSVAESLMIGLSAGLWKQIFVAYTAPAQPQT
jgi:hypothetical protein